MVAHNMLLQERSFPKRKWVDPLLRVRERDRMIQNPIIAAIKKSTQVDNHLWLPSFRRY
jgi:hypothetical protein